MLTIAKVKQRPCIADGSVEHLNQLQQYFKLLFKGEILLSF